MTRRQQRLVSFALAIVLAGMVPPALTLLLAWQNAESEARDVLGDAATTLQERADDIFASSEATLADLASHVERGCGATTLAALRRAVYDSLYFREAGLIYDGAVQCTSEKAFDPPVPIRKADHLTMPVGRIHIAAPDRTLAGEVSIIVIWRVDDGMAVNLLVNPAQLTEPLRGTLGAGQIGLRLLRSDDAVLAATGTLRDDAPLAVHAASTRFPLRVEAEGSRDWLLGLWHRRLPPYLAAGLLLSLAIFLLLRHFGRRERSIDFQLRDALDLAELRVHYQPVHRVADGRVAGVEALLRWQHPERGLVLPGVFVPTAEASGFIIPMTHWLMRTVCAELAPLIATHPEFYVAINLSPDHFADPRLPQEVGSIFGSRFAAGRLVFELTERELVEGTEATRASIMRLREQGARLALDDFGTGYSSLHCLAQFQFDLLKIDKAFVDAIGTGSVTAGLVADMHAMARRLGMKTIAEGVETEAQLAHLRALGVDFVQGWYYAKAMPVQQLGIYLRQFG